MKTLERSLEEPSDTYFESSWNDSLGMIGRSGVMQELRQQVRKVSASDACVLVSGESGTGKELVARAIHRCSQRAHGPFVAVNCAAIAPALIQSELFGYERGAFTGARASKQGLIEAASGGSLFLDEIGDLPMKLQANLLRFLQEQTIQRVGSTHTTHVDTRVVVASHVNLAQAVSKGQFREDLYYRLNVLSIAVPTLRERIADVPELARYFLHKFNAHRSPHSAIGFVDQAMSAMASHHWPGNVRELSNRVERAVVMSDHKFLTVADLALQSSAPPRPVLSAARTLAEQDAIVRALNSADHNITHAARALGVSRMTLYRLMDKHGIVSSNEAVRMQRG